MRRLLLACVVLAPGCTLGPTFSSMVPDLPDSWTGKTSARSRPVPEPVENLFAIQEAKLKLARLGADYLVFRGGRTSVGPVVLGSGELRELRSQVETAVYSTGNREVTLRGAEFRGALDLVDAMLAARQAG